MLGADPDTYLKHQSSNKHLSKTFHRNKLAFSSKQTGINGKIMHFKDGRTAQLYKIKVDLQPSLGWATESYMQ